MYYDKRTEEVEAPAPVKLEPWQEVLLEAANIIRKQGWTQGALLDWQGRVCVVGAIKMAINMPMSSVFFHENISAAYHLAQYLGVVKLADWNDSRNRTKEEVIAALEGAAKAG